MKNLMIARALNVAIFIFVLICAVWCISGTGFHIMYTPKNSEVSGLGVCQYFTTDSNILMGVAAIIMAFWQARKLKDEHTEIPKWVSVLYLAATTSVTLTFLVVIFFLTPTGDDIPLLYTDTNLFFHVLVPIAAIVNFCVFQKNLGLSGKHVFVGIVPFACYAVFYLWNSLSHMVDGKISKTYDFYGFLQGGPATFAIVIVVMFAVTLLISFILFKINNRK